MITVRRSEDRGHADHGWLDTYHTFSFAGYHDPDFTQFGPLRVLNQDRVAPGQGFGTHGHQNMEIVSYVLDGVLEHKDSMGNGSQLRPGTVQLMSAGRGVMHSEFNGSEQEGLHFLQMWVLPRSENTVPRYEEKHFDGPELDGALRLVVSPDGAGGSLSIDQDARLFAGRLSEGASAEHALPTGREAWIHVARGRVSVNGESLGAGDGAAVVEELQLTFVADEDAEVLVWELPGMGGGQR